MKAGERFTCKGCGQTAFAKAEKILDGWDVKGERLVCPFCGAEAGVLEAEEAVGRDKPEDAGRAALLALLGGGEMDSALAFHADDEEKRFCRDCAHAVVNAFAVICTKQHQEVQPMDDCPEYKKRALSSQAAGKKFDF